MRIAKMVGIDLSHHNTITNWKYIAEDNDFVMLKLGGEERGPRSFRIDPTFKERYKKAKENNLHVGAYFFMGKIGNIERDPEYAVEWVISQLKGFSLDMPVAIDFENQWASKKNENTEYVKDWCVLMEDAGYYVSIYASEVSGFHECLNAKELEAFDKWVARYRTKEPDLSCGMWQYISRGIVRGVKGYVDRNFAYIDYPAVIEKKGLNPA